MSKEKDPGANKDDRKLSDNRCIEDFLDEAVTNPHGSSAHVQQEIIKAMNNCFGYEYSALGQSITIIGLCDLLPELTKEEIVSAMVDMRAVAETDSSTGAIHFLAHLFE